MWQQTIIIAATVILSSVIGFWYLQDLRRAWQNPRLFPVSVSPANGPLLSIIIPARNEALRIGACLEGLAGQSYQRFEVIVLNDHSSDCTAAVASSYTAMLPMLSVVAGAPLPADWAGKCWACWQASRQAQGEWFLFLDADVIPAPELLATLVGRIQAEPIDMLTLAPLMQLHTLAERIVLPAFISLIYQLYPFTQVNDPGSPIAFAIGQCILIRREAYYVIDGHRSVRASILEDMELAQRIKAAGKRLEAADGPDVIAVHMYNGWRDLIEGLSKNAAAGYNHSGWHAARAGMRQCIQVVAPINLLIAAGWWAGESFRISFLICGLLLGTLALISWGILARWRYRIHPAWGLLFPIGTAIYFGLATRAMVRVRSGQGVVWKGRVFRS